MKSLVIFLFATLSFTTEASEESLDFFSKIDEKINLQTDVLRAELAEKVVIDIDEFEVWHYLYDSSDGCIVISSTEETKRQSLLVYEVVLAKKTETWIPLFSKRIKNSYWQVSL